MKATELLRTRVVLSEGAFAELVVWRVRKPVRGSTHAFNRHFNTTESPYTFETPEKLVADFQADIARWNRENRHS